MIDYILGLDPFFVYDMFIFTTALILFTGSALGHRIESGFWFWSFFIPNRKYVSESFKDTSKVIRNKFKKDYFKNTIKDVRSVHINREFDEE